MRRLRRHHKPLRAAWYPRLPVLARHLADSPAAVVSCRCTAAFGLAALTGFLTVWANLAAGMLGSEADPANLMFAAVLAAAAVGALVVRFRPAGMAWAMAVAGLAQLAVVAIAAATGRYGTYELLLTACFALPWFASALLFAKAG